MLIQDASHAVPHTRRWLLSWTEVIRKLVNGEIKLPPGFILLEAYDAVREAINAGEVDCPYAETTQEQERSESESVR